MGDEQNPNDPQYDWLYAGQPSVPDREPTRQPPRPSEPDHDARPQPDTDDAEQTRQIPRPSETDQDPPPQPTTDDAEQTRQIPRPSETDQDPPPQPTTDDAEQTRQIPRPSETDQDPPPQPPADDAEQTQAVGTSPEHTQLLDLPREPPAPIQPLEAPSGPQVQSFGGTYPTPPPQSPPPPTQPAGDGPPRYAAPAPDQGRGRATPPSAPATTDRPASGRRKKRNWWVRGVVLVLVAWLIFLVVVPIWAWQKISKVDAEPAGGRPDDTPGTTYLLVGSDEREDLSKEERAELGTGNAAGERTDTIIMLHVPEGDGPRLLLSVPRDSYVDIPRHGMDKINAAYSLGGPSLLVEAIEGATQVRIDNYVEVGFAGFVDVVDAVGGITICPETAIDDPRAGGLKLEKGCQEVDGITALGYSRSRAFPLGDITRAEHQREVITAVGQKAASWQTVVFPWRYLRVNMAAAETLRVGEDVGPIDLARFAWAMSHTGAGDAKRCVVPYTDLGASTPVGSAVLWDDDAASELFADIRRDDTEAIRCSATGQ